MAKRYCEQCGEEMKEKYHFLDRCEKLELINARKEINQLKRSGNEWRDAWYQLREIIGNLWWHHPAINSDEQRAYYQVQQQRAKENGS